MNLSHGLLGIALCAVIFFASGCSKHEPVHFPVEEQSADSVGGPGTSSNEALRLLTCSSNHLGTQSSDGFYRIIQLGENTSNILYLDFTSRHLLYLCGRPNCSHNSEECTSWLGPEMMGSNLFVDKNTLYCLTAAGQLYSMNLDGSSRVNRGTGPSGSELAGDLVSDGTFLYWMQPFMNGQETNFKLMRFAVQTGQTETLAVFDAATQIEAASERTLILRHSREDGTGELTRYYIDEGNEDILRTFLTGEEYGRGSAEQYVYIDLTDRTLNAFTYETMQTKVVVRDLPFDSSTPLAINEFCDGHFAFTIHRSNGDSPYMIHDYVSVNLETGEVCRALPVADNRGEGTAAAIAAILPDAYLVRSAILEQEYHIAMNDGTTKIMVAPFAQYSMISKEDYWAGLSHYQPVKADIVL